MKKLITTLTLLIVLLSIVAQVPEKINYQAVIRNSKNEIISNQAIGMKISIYYYLKTLEVIAYSETQIPSTNENGLITIEIGGGKVVSGVFSDIDWGSKSYYLKTEIDPNGRTNYTITSDTQILSVPYALHAQNVTNIPDNLVSTIKIADGAVTGPKLNQSGATKDQVWKWNGSEWAPASDNTAGWTLGISGIYTGNRIGIGNTNPQYPLEVEGKININEVASTGNDKPLWYNGKDIILEVRDDVANGMKHFIWGGFNPDFGHIFDSPVGINVIPGTDKMLWVNGAATKPGGGTWDVMSDARLKDIHGNFTRGLDAIINLKPVTFNYKKDNPLQLPSSPEYIGFIAQEVINIFPEAVKESSQGFLEIDIHPILVSFVNGFKELKTENESLKAENIKLNERLEKLEKLLLGN